MFAVRALQTTPSSVMTLEVFSFGLANSEGTRGTTYLRLGYAYNPSLRFQDGDAFETVTWTSDTSGGVASNLEIGLGGRAQFTPPGASIAHLINDYLGITYGVWTGPMQLRLYFEADNMVCESTVDGEMIMRDTFPAVPGAPYAAFETGPSSIGPNGQSGAVYLGEWKVPGGIPVTAPYPFTPEFGDLAGGPGEAGVIRIG